MIIVLSFCFQWCWLDKDFSHPLRAPSLMYCLWGKVFHEIIFLYCNGICCCKLYIYICMCVCIYIYEIVLGHLLLWCAARQSRAYSTVPNGKCLSSSCLPGEWLLSSKTWCPPSSSFSSHIFRKRTWDHIILCEGKKKQDFEQLTSMFLSVLSYRQILQLVVYSACTILFLGIVNLKSGMS